jgi:peptide-methionine (S)-S-oxide reductase
MEQEERAIFAGGCFWCLQPEFDVTPGVIKTTVGYTGGNTPFPKYEQVISGITRHVEAIEITFHPQKTNYNKLLEVFWSNIDPTDDGGQFADRGNQYRPVIFFTSSEQKQLATLSYHTLESSNKYSKPIVVTIEPASTFYPAEEYHQNYYKKNSAHYSAYKEGSGRGPFLRKQKIQ